MNLTVGDILALPGLKPCDCAQANATAIDRYAGTTWRKMKGSRIG